MIETLAYVPWSRNYKASLDAIKAIRGIGEWIFDSNPDGEINSISDRWENITRKGQRAQRIANYLGSESIFFIEDDMIPPPDAYEKMNAIDADIIYGFGVWRNEPHRWFPITEIEGDTHLITLDMQKEKALESWGKQIEVLGIGTYCTLIRKSAFSKFKIERRGIHCMDWYISLDAKRLGLKQVCDLSVIVGHMTDENHALWPTPFNPSYYELKEII